MNALYLMRHGQTAINADGRLRGTLDAPLDIEGEKQVVASAKRLRGRGIKLMLVSPLLRARESADLVADVLGIEGVWPASFLRPWNYGELAGLPTEQGSTLLRKLIANPEQIPPGGEPFQDFYDRWRNGLGHLLLRAEREPVLAVTHSRNIYAVPHILTGRGTIPTEGPPDPGGVVAIGRNSKGDFWMRGFGNDSSTN